MEWLPTDYELLSARRAWFTLIELSVDFGSGHAEDRAI
jgi:hypothetical protein